MNILLTMINNLKLLLVVVVVVRRNNMLQIKSEGCLSMPRFEHLASSPTHIRLALQDMESESEYCWGILLYFLYMLLA